MTQNQSGAFCFAPFPFDAEWQPSNHARIDSTPVSGYLYLTFVGAN